MKIYRLPVLFKLSNTPINPFWYSQLKRIIKEEKPDLINAHAPVPFMADVAALASGSIPFILTYHAGPMEKKKILIDFIIKLYEKFILTHTSKRSKKVICSSGFVMKTMMKNNLQKSQVIHPAVDVTLFKPSNSKKYQKPTVLFVGRQANYSMKGLFYLMEAIQDLPNVELHIVGEKIASNQKISNGLAY